MRLSIADFNRARLTSLTEEGKIREDGGLKIYSRPAVEDNPAGNWHVEIWRGRASNPYANYLFRNRERAETYIAEQVAAESQRQASATQRKATAAAQKREMAKKIQVGTILHYSWGWEQTNCEFYQVVDRKRQTVAIRQIAAQTVPGTEGFMCENVRPVPDQFTGEPITKRIGTCGINMKHGIATPCEPGSQHYSSWYA
jgi:hypothetical protein